MEDVVQRPAGVRRGLEGERAVRGQGGSGGLGPEEGHGPRAENDGCTVRSTDSSLGVTVLTGVSGPPRGETWL